MELEPFMLEFYKENMGFTGFGFFLHLHVGSSSDLLWVWVLSSSSCGFFFISSSCRRFLCGGHCWRGEQIWSL